MDETEDFERTVSEFRQFLAQSGHPTKLVWVFRDDIWKRAVTDVFVRVPSQRENLALARKVFHEGRAKGLVDVHAVAVVDDAVAATIWFPRTDDEEIQGWNRGTKLTIAEPLVHAKTFGSFRWWLFSFLPRFKNYQAQEFTIGTRSWAAA